MKMSLLLFAILGAAAASPININHIEDPLLSRNTVIRNSLIEDQLKGLLEDLRTIILSGTDGVPILDPLVIDDLSIDEKLVAVPGLNLVIKDAKVTKLSSFVVNQLTVQRTTLIPLRYRLTLDSHIPVLEVNSGHYDLFVPVDGVTIFGRGNAKINLIEPRITGHVIARPVLGLGSVRLRLEECQIKFHLRAFDSQINGLLGGDANLGAFVNTFLRHFVPDLVKLYEDDISETLSTLVLEVGNEILADLNLVGIIG